MKPYFEYPLDQAVRARLERYYEDAGLGQHAGHHLLKAALKVDRLRRLTSFTPAHSVLDLGCSRGHVLRLLAGEIGHGLGVDISRTIIEENRRSGPPPQLDFLPYDGERLDLDERFDRILLLDVLEHAFEPDALLKLVRGLLKPDGQLLVQVPFTGWLSERLFGQYHQGHLRYYDPPSLKLYLERAGFQVQRLAVRNSVPFSVFFLRYPGLWRVLDRLAGLVPPRAYPYFGEIMALAVLKETHEREG